MPSHPIGDFFAVHFNPRREVAELALSRFLNVFGSAMFALFSAIYLYQIGFEPWQIMAGHAGGYLLRFFINPLFGKFTAQYGYERTIAAAIPFAVMNYVMLAWAPMWAPAFVISVVFYQIYLSFYWTGFHADMAANARKDARGRDFSLIVLLTLVAASVAPIAGGFIVDRASFVVLLVITGLVQGASLIPLFTTRENVRPYKFSYFAPFRLLRKKDIRRFAVGLMGWGEEIVLVFLWPIFVFLVVQDYVVFGWIAGSATLVTGLLTFFAGMLADRRTKKGKRKGKGLQRVSTIVMSGVWVLRSFASSATQVFMLDTGSKWARSFVSIMNATKAYDKTDRADRIALVILWNQWVAFGKFLAGTVAAILLFVFAENLAAAFIPAALLSLLLLLL
ncbi:MAG: hypothetical protein KC925_02250 [Candidatus Doudnabacteria bacterium]|nr:hypothetical protein [Candidatus Doudnabacteria bacterium]